MPYSNYKQYQGRGGKLTEDEYGIMAQKASEWIDHYTMGRAASSETMGPHLYACECDLIDHISALPDAAGVRTESNDGYSVTYLDSSARGKEIDKILKTHLSFPENLLVYAGRAIV